MSAAPNARCVMSRCGYIMVYSRARAAPNASEWVRLVRAERECGLQQDPIGG